MRVLILGANGYIGKRIGRYLEENGHIVVKAIRNIQSQGQGLPERVVEAELASIRDDICRNGCDWIINCAVRYEGNGIAIHEIVDANMIYALKVLSCAVELGVKNFLTFDTSLPKELNLYSFTKKTFADFGKFYSERYGINFTNVVLEMFYGEDEPENRFLVRCCRTMLKGEELLLTKGTQKRDVIYINDVCEAVRILLKSSLNGFHDVPLGSGEAVQLRVLLEYMHKVLGSKSKLYFGAMPMRKEEPDCIADITLLKKYGFVVRYPWKLGIEQLCKKLRMEGEDGATGIF